MSASWIHKLNESDSRLHKEDVIRQALEASVLGSTNAQIFLGLLKACYNPFVTFNVRQVPDTVGIVNAENPWTDFNELLLKLSRRQLTGNAARDAIEEMAYRFDSDEWNNFCAPVIRRDMRAGISDKTINKICKKTEYEVPIFGCQLATNSEGRPEMKGIKRLEPKLDGVRVLMTVIPSDDGDVTVISLSRNGKLFENFGHIEDQIRNNFVKLVRKAATSNLSMGFVLDGEVIGNTFQELMRQARRKENVQATDSVFNIFDIIPLEDFRRGHWNAQLSKRIQILEDMRPIIINMPNVELLPHIMVDLDTAGFEGIMIKDVGAPYECKRNTFWMKWKPTITVDLTVVGLEEGTGRNEGRLGALVCEGEDDGKFIQVNVGSGYSDEDRDSYWENSNAIIGRTAEILCDVITQNQDGSYSLRFPRFVRFRDDK
jgi:DNA ligase-1